MDQSRSIARKRKIIIVRTKGAGTLVGTKLLVSDEPQKRIAVQGYPIASQSSPV
jgi:hypothetical protein